MIEKRTLNLIKENKDLLSNNGIKIDEVKSENLNYLERAIRIDLISEDSFCRITAFHSGRLYIQILDISTEKTIFIYDDIPEPRGRERFIIDSIKKMIK